MTDLKDNLPQRAISTDDPLRAKMLVAHHLEYASPIYENGDVFIYGGSFNGVEIALISTGLRPVAPFISEARRLGVSELLFIGECTSAQHPLRTVLLADGGDNVLLQQTKREAARVDIPISVCAITSRRDAPHDRVSAPCAAEVYEAAVEHGLAALAILTVSVNTRTKEEMEEHERRSRLYAASRLAFEVFGTID